MMNPSQLCRDFLEPTSPEPATKSDAAARPPGRLKVYLGATPGAGKTFAMLREAHRLRRQGRDVVVAYVETYRRPRTVEWLEGLEPIPRAASTYKGATLDDMDEDAVL